eukprot:TRINITY_DN55519_c0_g1_i1.p1 TRINITY_DN55519_c0_g1~~TRINITY_DN55519_c0_g1_i1.p1  ORF type:complete len:274 (+),score=39.49 TRINITY_DN55519_c0_g1_i1:84-824(+)
MSVVVEVGSDETCVRRHGAETSTPSPPQTPEYVHIDAESSRSVKVVCISDTHTMHDSLRIPLGDVLICCGDWTKKGTKKETDVFNSWLGRQEHATKIVVRGNHEAGPFSEFEKSQLSSATHFLANDWIQLESGLRVFGVDWKQQFTAKRHLNPVIEEFGEQCVDIFLVHEPPFGILDGGLGCETILELCHQLAPRVAVFGHIHEEHGVVAKGGTTYINCSVVAKGMNPREVAHPAVVFDIVPRNSN